MIDIIFTPPYSSLGALPSPYKGVKVKGRAYFFLRQNALPVLIIPYTINGFWLFTHKFVWTISTFDTKKPTRFLFSHWKNVQISTLL